MKQKVNFFLCTQWRHIGGVEGYLHLFLTSLLDGGLWSASRPGHFNPEREGGVDCKGGCVGFSESGFFGEDKKFVFPMGIEILLFSKMSILAWGPTKFELTIRVVSYLYMYQIILGSLVFRATSVLRYCGRNRDLSTSVRTEDVLQDADDFACYSNTIRSSTLPRWHFVLWQIDNKSFGETCWHLSPHPWRCTKPVLPKYYYMCMASNTKHCNLAVSPACHHAVGCKTRNADWTQMSVLIRQHNIT
jgi:hypothetical protein